MDTTVVTPVFIAVILRYLQLALTSRSTRQRERERGGCESIAEEKVKAKSHGRSEGLFIAGERRKERTQFH
jgi:hypothetical protein